MTAAVAAAEAAAEAVQEFRQGKTVICMQLRASYSAILSATTSLMLPAGCTTTLGAMKQHV
jgi:hypothetical protein